MCDARRHIDFCIIGIAGTRSAQISCSPQKISSFKAIDTKNSSDHEICRRFATTDRCYDRICTECGA